MKRKIVIGAVVLMLAGGVYGYSKIPTTYKAEPVQETKAEEPTRLEQTQALIKSLKDQRSKDPSFIQETERLERELNQKFEEMKKALAKERDAQLTLDALFVVKTQYETELSALEESTK